MKLYRYLINVKSTYGCKNNVYLLAGNKKEALKFAKILTDWKLLSA